VCSRDDGDTSLALETKGALVCARGTNGTLLCALGAKGTNLYALGTEGDTPVCPKDRTLMRALRAKRTLLCFRDEGDNPVCSGDALLCSRDEEYPPVCSGDQREAPCSLGTKGTLLFVLGTALCALVM
jgi:hypothetical protein